MILSGLRKNQIAAFVKDGYGDVSFVVFGKTKACCGQDFDRELAELEFVAPDGYTANIVTAFCPDCKQVRWWDE